MEDAKTACAGERVGEMIAIFQCTDCGTDRIYGNSEPENKRVLAKCEGECGKTTVHEFVQMSQDTEVAHRLFNQSAKVHKWETRI